MLHAREIFQSQNFPIAFLVFARDARHMPGSHGMRGETQCATKRIAELAEGGGMKVGHEPSAMMMKGLLR